MWRCSSAVTVLEIWYACHSFAEGWPWEPKHMSVILHPNKPSHILSLYLSLCVCFCRPLLLSPSVHCCSFPIAPMPPPNPRRLRSGATLCANNSGRILAAYMGQPAHSHSAAGTARWVLYEWRFLSSVGTVGFNSTSVSHSHMRVRMEAEDLMWTAKWFSQRECRFA